MYRMMVYTNWYSYNTLSGVSANGLDIPSCLMYTISSGLCFERARVTFLKLLVCRYVIFETQDYILASYP